MTIVCYIHEGVCWLSVSYMTQVGGFLSDTSGRLSVICQLLEADGRLYVSYMRQGDGYLSIK
jgi:hypothetical protein